MGTMPDLPAKKIFGFSWGHQKKVEERLATKEELAEYGATQDPQTEQKILALFEEQLVQDLVKKTSLGTATGGALEARKPAKQQAVIQNEVSSVQPAPEKMEAVAEKSVTTLAVAVAEEKKEAAIPVAEPRPEILAKTEPQSVPETVVAPPALPPSLPPQVETAITPSLPEVMEFVGGTSDATSDLLEVAEALDQHRLWVESSGAQGKCADLSGAKLLEADLTGANLQGAQLQKANLRGADLSMANLRGANLVEADLRETNLLGTEFSGANMMGANLYGAQGLWVGRLGGTNLFDAALPESVATLTGSKTIAQFTHAARWFYLVVMGLCAGAGILIAMTTDVRLLLDQSAWRISRIPNLLPLQGFYLGAPLLLTVLYLRLQFLLLRLWGSMGALPAVFPDGQTPEKDGRWYLMGPIRPYLRWARDPRSPLGLVECYVAMSLGYWAVPAALFFFWLRYLVLQDYRGTLLHVFLFTLASIAACALPRIVKRVLRPGDWTEESTQHFLQDVLSSLRGPVIAGAALFLLSLGVIRGLPSDSRVRPEIAKGDPRRWAATLFHALGYRPFADLTDETFSSSHAKPASVDGPVNEAPGPRLNEINLRYARGFHAAFANARLWRANLEGTSLAEANFRGANLREANLRSAAWDRVQAAGANLVSIDAQDALFAGGNFQGADLSFADLARSTLTTANLQRATLYSVNLRAANLLRADLSHTDLRDAKLEQANLSLTTLEQTDFSAARMAGVNLSGAQARGTIFLEGDLSHADLRGADFPGAVLRQVKLDGAQVMGADFRGALGLEAWQLCATPDWRGAQLDADVKAATEQSCGSGTPVGPRP
jgi:uncharacterized protein YjbI with pentapeptide repeats